MMEHYRLVVQGADARVKQAVKKQVLDPSSRFYGGICDAANLVEAKYTIYRFTTMVAAYSCPDSKWYRDQAVFQRILLAIDYVARAQHENGLFDYIDCNFLSAPDTAFCVKRMLPALHYLHGAKRTEQQQQIYLPLYEIVKKAANGLLLGGFHTPNHRWAIASNLMECGQFFNSPALTAAAAQYLNEGIDCNADGEYAEKSAGNYNRINNDAMIALGDATGNAEFYQYAVRNLTMMLTYLEPDGSIFTANSTRQDNGKRIFPKDYYTEYLRMGLEQNIPEFLDMCNTIFVLVLHNNLSAPDILIHFLNNPQWKTLEHSGIYCQPNFEKFYSESGIMRLRQGEATLTLMQGKANFLYLSNQSITLSLKIGASFCEHRAFLPETFEKSAEGGYILGQVMRGWYYLPFAEKPSTSDWWKMDHSKRPMLHGPNLTIETRVLPVEDGADVQVSAFGVENAPLRLEMAVAGATEVSGAAFALPATPGGALVAKEGDVVFENQQNSLSAGPAFGEHTSMLGKFGSEAPSPHSFTLYFTAYTPFNHTFHLRSGV